MHKPWHVPYSTLPYAQTAHPERGELGGELQRLALQQLREHARGQLRQARPRLAAHQLLEPALDVRQLRRARLREQCSLCSHPQLAGGGPRCGVMGTDA